MLSRSLAQKKRRNRAVVKRNVDKRVFVFCVFWILYMRVDPLREIGHWRERLEEQKSQINLGNTAFLVKTRSGKVIQEEREWSKICDLGAL